MESFAKIWFDTIQKEEIKKYNKEHRGISKYDDRMMNDGTINIYHRSLQEDYTSIRDYNARLISCSSGF